MRVGLFGDKTGGSRLQGIVTKVGTKKFEEARVRLAQLAGKPRDLISDGDTFEYLARGHDASKYFLRERESDRKP